MATMFSGEPKGEEGGLCTLQNDAQSVGLSTWAAHEGTTCAPEEDEVFVCQAADEEEATEAEPVEEVQQVTALLENMQEAAEEDVDDGQDEEDVPQAYEDEELKEAYDDAAQEQENDQSRGSTRSSTASTTQGQLSNELDLIKINNDTNQKSIENDETTSSAKNSESQVATVQGRENVILLSPSQKTNSEYLSIPWSGNPKEWEMEDRFFEYCQPNPEQTQTSLRIKTEGPENSDCNVSSCVDDKDADKIITLESLNNIDANKKKLTEIELQVTNSLGKKRKNILSLENDAKIMIDKTETECISATKEYNLAKYTYGKILETVKKYSPGNFEKWSKQLYNGKGTSKTSQHYARTFCKIPYLEKYLSINYYTLLDINKNAKKCYKDEEHGDYIGKYLSIYYQIFPMDGSYSKNNLKTTTRVIQLQKLSVEKGAPITITKAKHIIEAEKNKSPEKHWDEIERIKTIKDCDSTRDAIKFYEDELVARKIQKYVDSPQDDAHADQNTGCDSGESDIDTTVNTIDNNITTMELGELIQVVKKRFDMELFKEHKSICVSHEKGLSALAETITKLLELVNFKDKDKAA